MENENIVTLQFRFTRRSAFLALALLFLCWHPRPLGSETLQLTTYYPAPYGGYVSLLTTQRTLLAREGNNGNRYAVGIRNDNPQGVLEVKMNKNSMDRFVVDDDPNVGIELRSDSSGGTPFIDFANTSSADFNARIIMGAPGMLRVDNANLGVGTNPAQRLHVNGNVQIDNGYLMGVCRMVGYSSGSTTPCPPGYFFMGSYGGGAACPSGGLLFLGGALENPGRWVPHYEMNCSGNMICCRIQVS